MRLLSILFFVLFSTGLFAQSKVAVVKLMRGEADVLTLGKTTKLKVDDWVESGAVIKTAEKSFVKLVFIDKSQMNVGPNSEMKIESFSGKDSGVIDLVKGKIRSQVTKDYLQIKDKDKSKLFIKTQNAVMGVRGTDFMISTNGINTSTVLFEGEIVFNKLDQRGEVSSQKLEEIVDRGVRMYPGEFSVQEATRSMPTVPSLLNVQQKEKLEKNQDFSTARAPSNAAAEQAKSIVPAGLNGKVISNNSETIKSEVAAVAPADGSKKEKSDATKNPEGFVKGDMVKPANGSFVHIDSGVVISPGSDAVLDPNTDTYIPTPDSGSVADNGDYVPPANMEITYSGDILKLNPETRELEKLAPPPPVITDTTPTDPLLPPEPAPLPPPPELSGGIQGVYDPAKATSVTDTTIIVKPN